MFYNKRLSLETTRLTSVKVPMDEKCHRIGGQYLHSLPRPIPRWKPMGMRSTVVSSRLHVHALQCQPRSLPVLHKPEIVMPTGFLSHTGEQSCC